jgi:hypothetical protein
MNEVNGEPVTNLREHFVRNTVLFNVPEGRQRLMQTKMAQLVLFLVVPGLPICNVYISARSRGHIWMMLGVVLLRYVVLCYAVLRYAVLYCPVWCCVVLCCGVVWCSELCCAGGCI